MAKPSDWLNSRVFVTGATGLLGSHLVQALVNRGAFVVCLVRDQVPKSLFYAEDPAWRLDRRSTTVRGSVEDYSVLERALNEYEIDTVFHLAAQTIVGAANRSPLATFKANIEGTWNVLEAARAHQSRIKRVLVASSDKAYGNLEGKAYDESFPLRGEHPYDVSKSCADLISRAYFCTYGLPVTVTRCGNFFGPGDLNFNRLIPGVINDIFNNRSPLLRSNGQFIRDYIYTPDGAHSYLTLAEAMVGPSKDKIVGEAFNFSYGLRLSVLEVVKKLLAVCKREDLIPTILNEASKEIPVQCLDSSKAKKLLHWEPLYGFDQGLASTVDWYVKSLAKWNHSGTHQPPDRTAT